jgi:hypothetical protein
MLHGEIVAPAATRLQMAPRHSRGTVEAASGRVPLRRFRRVGGMGAVGVLREGGGCNAPSPGPNKNKPPIHVRTHLCARSEAFPPLVH